jgi:hypothetical protein
MRDEKAKTLYDRARERLVKVLGTERTDALLNECMTTIGLTDVRNPTELLALAEALLGQAGLIKFVGQSLKAQAVLLGAEHA